MPEGLGHGVKHQHVVDLAGAADRQLQGVPVKPAARQDVRLEKLHHGHHLHHIPGRPWLEGLPDAPELAGPDGVHVVHGAAVRLHAAEHPVRPGRAVRVQPGDAVDVGQRERRELASRRVADVEAAVGDEDEDAVAGGEHVEVLNGGRPDDGAPLAAAVVHGVDPSLLGFSGGEERERGLAAAVGEEELGIGGESVAPGAADGAAPEYGFRGQARKDLPDDEILGERGHAAGRFRHGRRRTGDSGGIDWGFFLQGRLGFRF